MVELKQLQKQLKTMVTEKTKAEQAAYDTGMTKTTQILPWGMGLGPHCS